MYHHVRRAAVARMLSAISRQGVSQSLHRAGDVNVVLLRPLLTPLATLPAAGLATDATVVPRGPSDLHPAMNRDMLPGRIDTTVKRNRGLRAVIGGGIGLVVGGIIGYEKGDPHAAFDQVYGAAILGGVAALVGAIVGAVLGPRVP